MGAEKLYTAQMIDAVNGRPVDASWERDALPIINRGSDNIDLLAMAVAVLSVQRQALTGRTVYDDPESVITGDVWDIVEEWLDLSLARGYMLKEAMSGKYWHWHFIPVWTFYAYAPTDRLRQRLRKWLRATLAYWALAAGWERESYLTPSDGCRRRDGKGRPIALRYRRSRAARSEGGCYKEKDGTEPLLGHLWGSDLHQLFAYLIDLSGPGNPKGASQHGWIWTMVEHLEKAGEILTEDEQRILRKHVKKGDRSDHLVDWIGGWLPEEPVVIGRGPRGVWSVAMKGGGVSTSPVMGTAWWKESRELEFAMPHSWKRQQGTGATTELNLDDWDGGPWATFTTTDGKVEKLILPSGLHDSDYILEFSIRKGVVDKIAGATVVDGNPDPDDPDDPHTTPGWSDSHISNAARQLGRIIDTDPGNRVVAMAERALELLDLHEDNLHSEEG